MRTRYHLASYDFGLFLSILFYYNLQPFKLTETNQAFLTFQTSLVKDDHIANLFFQFSRQFLMKFCLLFPNSIKFIQIILPIEYHIAQTCMGILV